MILRSHQRLLPYEDVERGNFNTEYNRYFPDDPDYAFRVWDNRDWLKKHSKEVKIEGVEHTRLIVGKNFGDVGRTLSKCSKYTFINDLDPALCIAASEAYFRVNLPSSYYSEHREPYLNSWFILEGHNDQVALVLRYQGHHNSRYFCVGDPDLLKSFIRFYPESETWPPQEQTFRFVLEDSIASKDEIKELMSPQVQLSDEIYERIRMVRDDTNFEKLGAIQLPQNISESMVVRILNNLDNPEIEYFLRENYPQRSYRPIWPPTHRYNLEEISFHLGLVDKSSQPENGKEESHYLHAMAGIPDTSYFSELAKVVGIFGDLAIDKKLAGQGVGSFIAAKVLLNFIQFQMQRGKEVMVVSDANDKSFRLHYEDLSFHVYKTYNWCKATRNS